MAAREAWLHVPETRGGAVAALGLGHAHVDEAPLCIVIADLCATDGARAFAHARELASLATEAGCAAWVTALSSEEGEAVADVADRVALARLDGLLTQLARESGIDARRVAVLGSGRGGTLAFLFGCHSSIVAAVGVVGGSLVYPSLGPDRPVQPLELALNLGAPCLLVFADDDPATPASEREHTAAVLSQFARTFDIVSLPGAAPWPRAEVRAAALAFLRETLELD